MKKVTKSYLPGLSNKGGDYRSIYKGNEYFNPKDMILNQNIFKMFQILQKKENINLINANQSIKLLNNSLKIYLQNIIQELIQHNRRRNYSKYILFSKHSRIISYNINVQRDPNPIINEKKNKLFHKKNLTLMRTINVDKKLDLLDKYNSIKNNKEIKGLSPEKEKEEKIEENSESNDDDDDFFQKKKRKKSEEQSNNKNDSDNDDKKEYQGILNVHQSHELTSNKLHAFKKFKMGKIELKDLVFYLEDNQTIPLNKQLLYKAYTEMTVAGNKKKEIEEDQNNIISI